MRKISIPISQRTWEEFYGLLTLLLFLAVTAFLFRSWEFALIVTASLGFHELGHVTALAHFGLKSRIGFGLAGAWTTSSLSERARLTHLQNATIHLAGPVFSLVLSLLALGLQRLWLPTDQHLGLLANFSAHICLLNLLPLGAATDGGKIVRRMVASINGGCRAKAILLPMCVTALVLLVYNLLSLPNLALTAPRSYLLGLLLVGFWITSSMFFESSRPLLPEEAASARMKPGQVYLLLLAVWSLLVLGLLIIAGTPFWLAPQYVMGSLANVVDLLYLIF